MNTCAIEGLGLELAYAVASVDRLEELREDLFELIGRGRVSENAVFRSYLDELSFEVPEALPGAASVIAVAVPTALMRVTFHYQGAAHDVMIPPQYYLPPFSSTDVRDALMCGVDKLAGNRLVRADSLQMKPLAVRSGLARYGRNNICYVDGMGSLLTLYAFFTDAELEESGWGDVRFMDACEHCRLCLESCPGRAIDAEKAVIDAGRCVTLYNEVAGDFPAWAGGDAHDALMGCMRCQSCCPANREALRGAGRLEDVDEQETRRILDGTPDDELIASLTRKLRGFPPASSTELFPLLTRNLRAVLRA